MNKNERIYLHKEDVWAEGDHWMTSASREIFEHFYKAIRNTFKERFQDSEILELAENIVHQRSWSINCFRLIMNTKNNTIPVLPPYTLGREKLPLEWEYSRNKEGFVSQNSNDFDPRIYLDFESFFTTANHGYGQDEESREIVYGLYFNFMKPFSKEKLQLQFEQEYQDSLSFLNEVRKDFEEFIKQTEYTNFHKFLLRDK